MAQIQAAIPNTFGTGTLEPEVRLGVTCRFGIGINCEAKGHTSCWIQPSTGWTSDATARGWTPLLTHSNGMVNPAEVTRMGRDSSRTWPKCFVTEMPWR